MMKQKPTDTNIQEIADKTAKIKSLQLLIDGLSKTSRHSLGQGHPGLCIGSERWGESGAGGFEYIQALTKNAIL